MTLSQIARVGTGILFALLIASIVLVGNQRLALADVPMPDVQDPDVPTSEVASDVPSGSDINSNLDVPSGEEIVCEVFEDLNEVGEGVEVPFPEFPEECGDTGEGGGGNGGGNGGGGNNNGGSKPKLTVTKVVVNDGGGTAVVSDFSLSATLSGEGLSESVGLSSGVQTELTTAGTWKVSEQQKDGYVGTFSGDCAADGSVTLASGESKNCTLTNTYTPDGGNNNPGGGSSSTTSGSGSGSSGGSSGGGGGTATTTPSGLVLGAAATSITACDQYLTAFIRTGKENDVEQVKRLQAVLAEFEKAEGVEITGVYDAATLAAVHAFQTKYASEILTPWGIKESTGFVYLTTRKKVNEIYCQGTKLFPLTSQEQNIVDKARTGNTSPATTQAVPATQSAPKEEQKGNDGQEASANTGASQTGNLWDKVKNFFKKVQTPSIR